MMEWVLNTCIKQEALRRELLPHLPLTSKRGENALIC